MTFPVRVDEIEGIRVVRDDLLPGGSKRRALTPLLARLAAQGYEEFVFGGPAEGYAQLALAHSANDVGCQATYFVAQRKQLHRHTQEALDNGAKIVQVKHGRLNVVQARARTYCEETGAYFFPLGFSTPDYEAELTRHISSALAGMDIDETWCVAGSGLLARCLQSAVPDAQHNAVRIGFVPKHGTATLWEAPEQFKDSAEAPPPFPSCANYDAKAWRFIKQHASAGALFWNVGA
jgi:hypothetical protein